MTFAAAPTSALNSDVYLGLGTWGSNGCQDTTQLWVRASNPAAYYGAKVSGTSVSVKSPTRSGNTVTITTSANNLVRSANLTCALVVSTEPVGVLAPTTTAYGLLEATSLANTYKPELDITRGEAMQGAAKGKTIKVKVKVWNDSRYADAKNVTLKASGSGLSITGKSKKLGTIKPRKTKTFTVKVKVKKGSARTLKLTATASGGFKATSKVKIVVIPKAKKYKSLSGRYFWGTTTSSLSDYSGWNPSGMYFLNKKWVYIGFPKNGKKPSCKKSSSKCKRYTYNKRTGVAKIGKQKFKVTTKGFSYKVKKKEGKTHFEPIALPKKGKRYSAKLIRHDWYGYCMLTCTATTERLTLGKNGRFVMSRSSVGSKNFYRP